MDGRRQIKAIMLKYNYFSNRFPVIFLVRPGSGRKHNVKKNAKLYKNDSCGVDCLMQINEI
jgi:hypothetical protein